MIWWYVCKVSISSLFAVHLGRKYLAWSKLHPCINICADLRLMSASTSESAVFGPTRSSLGSRAAENISVSSSFFGQMRRRALIAQAPRRLTFEVARNSTFAALKPNLLLTFWININLEFHPLPMIAIVIFAKDLSGQLCKTAGWYWVGLCDLMISSWSKFDTYHHTIT